MKALIKSAVFKLTLYYLTIIVGLSVGFSVFLYHISNNELNRGLRVPDFLNYRLSFPDYEHFRQDRLGEARSNLIANLVLFNFFILIAGGVVSYLLAQHNLEPIENAMEAQSRFTADASHELRTPLTAMQTEIEVALRKRGLTVAQARQLLQSNLEEVTKLKLLSENLLKLARKADQTLKLSPVSIEDITIDAVTAAVKSAQAKRIAIDNNVQPIKVMADRVALTEVFNLLIDNAIKYSPAKTTISLDSRKDGHQLIVSVQDQGPGIAAADLPHIFDRFYRSDNSRNKDQTDGYGLGLAIAQQLVELHNGSIKVASPPGQGTTFSVYLPLATKTS